MNLVVVAVLIEYESQVWALSAEVARSLVACWWAIAVAAWLWRESSAPLPRTTARAWRRPTGYDHDRECARVKRNSQ